jgi:hypothetical protein
VVEVLLLRLAIAMVIEHRWQMELKRRAELTRSGAHRKLLAEATCGLDDPVLQARLEAVHALRDLAGDFPDLRSAIRELLATRLRERSRAYDERALPPDLREMRRFLHEPGEGPVGSWTPF